MRRPQLFLFHFAGGNRYSFQFMLPFLSGLEVIPVELPGRGKRINESLLDEFDEAAADLFGQVTAQLTAPTFLLYGHSMGAYLALRVANMLEQAGKYPAALVVSGNAGPGLQGRVRKLRYQMNRQDFIEELKLLGGLPTELIENEELFNFFEPVLRADFRIVEENGLAAEPPVQAPVYALMGDEEEDVADIGNWEKFTSGSFNAEVLEGNHFFINRHPSRIAEIIRKSATKQEHVALPVPGT